VKFCVCNVSPLFDEVGPSLLLKCPMACPLMIFKYKTHRWNIPEGTQSTVMNPFSKWNKWTLYHYYYIYYNYQKIPMNDPKNNYTYYNMNFLSLLDIMMKVRNFFCFSEIAPCILLRVFSVPQNNNFCPNSLPPNNFSLKEIDWQSNHLFYKCTST